MKKPLNGAPDSRARLHVAGRTAVGTRVGKVIIERDNIVRAVKKAALPIPRQTAALIGDRPPALHEAT